MIKIAITSQNDKEVREVLYILSQNYEISSREDTSRDRQFVSVATLRNSKADEIEYMLELIESATGVDPAENDGRKSRDIVRAKSAASYILRHRYGLSLTKVGVILNCNHATILMRLKKMNNAEVGKTVPIEVAIRRALEAVDNKALNRLGHQNDKRTVCENI